MTVITPKLIDGPFPRGLPGEPGVYVFPAWVEQTYPLNALLPHRNCIWRSNKRTSQEPAFALDGGVSSVDWDLWVDGRGTEIAGAYAEIAIEKAGEAAGYAAHLAPNAPGGTVRLDADAHVPAAQLSATVILALLNSVIADLPSAAPAGGGLWNNGGVLCIASAIIPV